MESSHSTRQNELERRNGEGERWYKRKDFLIPLRSWLNSLIAHVSETHVFVVVNVVRELEGALDGKHG